MKTFSVGFSRPNHWMPASWAIMKVLKTNYSHTYLVFEVRSTGQKVVYHATGEGVHCLEYEHFKSKNTILDEIHIEDESARAEALRFCISCLGKEYGFMALLNILFKLKLGDGTKRLICSELVARALKLNINFDMATPRQIRESLENKEK